MFRTIVIKNRCKLDYSLNYLVYRGETLRKIHLSEISLLIIESNAVSLTTALIRELVRNNIAVIFCNEKHIPDSYLTGYNNNYHNVKNIFRQIQWEKNIKEEVWTDIVRNKISNQAKLLAKYGMDNSQLIQYLEEIENGDVTNREGHAAKVYFNMLFGSMSRRIPSFYNTALNYGYAVLLAAFCREITAAGYLTELGIWHKNEFNHYNLASDLMEPYRVIVDDMVMSIKKGSNDYKSIMANILNTRICMRKKVVYLNTAIEEYAASIFNVLNNGCGEINNFIGYELPIYEDDNNV